MRPTLEPNLGLPAATARRQCARLSTRLLQRAALAIALLALLPQPATAEDAALWSALRSGGHVALLRHAMAPGTGDPDAFTLGDCSTQRNLSQEGREQAARIGERFRANGIDAASVFSSQWCRCLDTATLLGLGPVREAPELNSFFERFELREPQTAALREWIGRQDLTAPLVLVTHQVNITALSDVYPSTGELVILRREGSGELTVLGSIETD
jgi:phosphohistidine phosphatase SixA